MKEHEWDKLMNELNTHSKLPEGMHSSKNFQWKATHSIIKTV